MPEIKEWRKRRDARAKAPAGGHEVEETDELEWQDAVVDVRSMGYVMAFADSAQWDSFGYASKAREVARLTALVAKREKVEAPNKTSKVKRKIRAEIREAWSEKKEKRERREDRRKKKDKRKLAEWEKAQAEGGEELGPVAAVRLAKEKHEADNDEMDVEYKALKREVRGERAAKKAKNDENERGGVGGLFGDME